MPLSGRVIPAQPEFLGEGFPASTLTSAPTPAINPSDEGGEAAGGFFGVKTPKAHLRAIWTSLEALSWTFANVTTPKSQFGTTTASSVENSASAELPHLERVASQRRARREDLRTIPLSYMPITEKPPVNARHIDPPEIIGA